MQCINNNESNNNENNTIKKTIKKKTKKQRRMFSLLILKFNFFNKMAPLFFQKHLTHLI